jgi:hypothetical protein
MSAIIEALPVQKDFDVGGRESEVFAEPVSDEFAALYELANLLGADPEDEGDVERRHERGGGH